MAKDFIVFGDEKIATHSFTEDTNEKHVERIAAGAGVCPTAWEDTAVVTASGLVSGLSCVTTGKGRIIVNCTADTTVDDIFKFRLVYYSSEVPSTSNIIGTSALITQSFTAVEDNSSDKVASVSVFANDVGASSVGIYVDTVSANDSMTVRLNAI